MKTMEVFDRLVGQYEQWYDDHPEVYRSEILALQEQFLELPQNIRGIEVGLGTGRFAVPLGIKEGVEPSSEMAKVALERGIEVMKGKAEHLPYAALQFDFVLFVTLCHLRDVPRALSEAFRVLKPGGALVIGFLDGQQPIAQGYRARGKRSSFYQKAHFHSVQEIEELLVRRGFRDLKYNQTLFGDLGDIDEIQVPREGHGAGSFVTVKAIKP